MVRDSDSIPLLSRPATVPSRPSSTPILNNYARCALFFIVEAAFLVLAAYLQANTIPLPYRLPVLTSLSITSLVKGAVIAVFNMWHAVAVAFASTILNDAYSREWTVRQNARKVASAKISKDSIDSVSIITSGELDRLTYLKSNHAIASRTFKLAFIASTCLGSLLHAGTSAIVVDNGKETRPITAGGLLLGTSQLSRDIMTMEHAMGLNLGYQTQANWIIPKPANTCLTKRQYRIQE